MALSTTGNEQRLTTLYASLTTQWAFQAQRYARSVKLFHESALQRSRRRARTIQSRRAAHDEVLNGSPRMTALHGPAVIGPERAPLAPAPPGQPHRASCSLLTARQLEIADLIAQGLTNDQIADRLVLTPGTVGNHVGHILRRLGASNRAQVAAWLVRQAASAPVSTDAMERPDCPATR